jgi:hypothetical protein
MRRKTGGRQRGTPNKKTAARKAQEAAIAAEIEDARSRGLEPLDYMLGVMRDVTADATCRDAMAKAAAPYRHPQLSSIKHGGDENPLDHAIRIIWEGMPAISDEGSDTRIQAEGSIQALPPPQAEAGDHCGASPSGKDGSDDQ